MTKVPVVVVQVLALRRRVRVNVVGSVMVLLLVWHAMSNTFHRCVPDTAPHCLDQLNQAHPHVPTPTLA